MGCGCCRSRLEAAMPPVAGQRAEAKGGTAEAGCEREDSTERNAQTVMLELGLYMCNCLRPASVTKHAWTEQIEADIAWLRGALTNVSTGLDKVRTALKSLADKVAQSKVRDTSRADP